MLQGFPVNLILFHCPSEIIFIIFQRIFMSLINLHVDLMFLYVGKEKNLYTMDIDFNFVI